jgi:hypothetical protein
MKRLVLAVSAVFLFSASFLHAGCERKTAESLVASLVKQAPGLRTEVLRLALDSAGCAAQDGLVKRKELLTVIDYSIPSTEPRLWVFDLKAKKILFRELVAHGKNSGGNVPRTFSNVHGSLTTSLGLFVTAGTYIGSNGYSLRLKGLERGVNDNAWDRAIVMHGAHYVSSIAIKALGRLGRSWGCPAVRSEIARTLIDTIRGGSPIFAYYPDREWLARSRFIKPEVQIARAE